MVRTERYAELNRKGQLWLQVEKLLAPENFKVKK